MANDEALESLRNAIEMLQDHGSHIQAPDWGSITDNPYWEAVHDVPQGFLGYRVSQWQPARWSLDEDDQVVIHRDWMTRRYAWGIPSPLSLAWIVEKLKGRSLVEVGAGTGYWAWQLQQLGVDTIAYDLDPPDRSLNGWHCRFDGEDEIDGTTIPLSHEPAPGNGSRVPLFHPVQQGGPEALKDHPDRALFLCWPPMGDLASDILAAYQGDTLIYCGEYGGCCASDDFVADLDADWDMVEHCYGHTSWDGIRDHLEIWRRR